MRWILHLPQGPSLRFGLCCPDPSLLNRPHPSRSQAQRDFTAQRLIRAAFAVRERLGDPRAVPSFRCIFRPDMPSSTTPGSPTPISSRAAVSTLAFIVGIPPRHSQNPAIRFTREETFEASWFTHLLRPASLLAPLYGSDRIAPAIGDFYIWASSGSVALPAARYHYNSDWTPLLAGLSPAGIAASFAAHADVSIVPPKIPQGGFSPLRLQRWPVR
jgi:hypothetical protein